MAVAGKTGSYKITGTSEAPAKPKGFVAMPPDGK